MSNWTGSAWTRVLHEKFLYDGWNLLGAFNGTNAAIIRSFLWGLDLSGSMKGAGGVGGLIAFRQHSGSLAGSHFAAYDGNGNVMALVDAKTGSASAWYEYDPFGQTIRASGAMATVNPVRFSSKVVDDETDYAYYGYRYLNPNAGRWLSRDPIEETGGRNILVFAGNNSVGQWDRLGLFWFNCTDNCDRDGRIKVTGINTITIPATTTPDQIQDVNRYLYSLDALSILSGASVGGTAVNTINNLLSAAYSTYAPAPQDVYNRLLQDYGRSELGFIGLWTQIEFERCTEKRCWSTLFFCKAKRWERHYGSPSAWKRYRVGEDSNTGAYWGVADAMQHAPAAARAHIADIMFEYDSQTF